MRDCEWLAISAAAVAWLPLPGIDPPPAHPLPPHLLHLLSRRFCDGAGSAPAAGTGPPTQAATTVVQIAMMIQLHGI
jgi:hypothetical protein